MDKNKIEELSGKALASKIKFQNIGTVNTYGRTPEELKEINTAYDLAKAEMIEDSFNLYKAQNP